MGSGEGQKFTHVTSEVPEIMNIPQLSFSISFLHQALIPYDHYFLLI